MMTKRRLLAVKQDRDNDLATGKSKDAQLAKRERAQKLWKKLRKIFMQRRLVSVVGAFQTAAVQGKGDLVQQAIAEKYERNFGFTFRFDLDVFIGTGTLG